MTRSSKIIAKINNAKSENNIYAGNPQRIANHLVTLENGDISKAIHRLNWYINRTTNWMHDKDKEVLFRAREILQNMQKGSRHAITNQRRGGTWLEQHHVDHVMSSDEALRYYKTRMDQAFDSSSMNDQEYFMARAYNTDSVARNIASGMYVKEMNAGVLSLDDLDNISASNGGSASNTSLTIGDIASTGPSGETNSDQDKTTSKVITCNIKDFGRDPEEIFSAKQIVNALYAAIDKRWPGNPKFKMVLTYLLCRSKTSHLIKEPLPFIDRVENIIEQIGKDGDVWTTKYQFYNRAGIPASSFKNVLNFLGQIAPEFSKDAYTNIQYHVSDGMDGPTIHLRDTYKEAKKIAKPGNIIHRHQNDAWTDSYDHEGNKLDLKGLNPDSPDTLPIIPRSVTPISNPNDRMFPSDFRTSTRDPELSPSLSTIDTDTSMEGDIPLMYKDNEYFDPHKAIQLGARFTPNHGWYVPKGVDIKKFPNNWFKSGTVFLHQNKKG